MDNNLNDFLTEVIIPIFCELFVNFFDLFRGEWCDVSFGVSEDKPVQYPGCPLFSVKVEELWCSLVLCFFHARLKLLVIGACYSED